MKLYSNATNPGDQKPPSFGIGSFLFAFVPAILFYLLLAPTVRHHLFRGGHPNRGSGRSNSEVNSHLTMEVRTPV
jgi:hypothetical protein